MSDKGICNRCGQEYVAGEEPDPCLGMIEGVREACCGHGNPQKAYVMFPDGLTFRGFKVEHHGKSKAYRNANG